MAPMVLGYWGVRGMCAPIRYLLEHTGQEYEYKNWSAGPLSDWFQEKPKLGIEFPNLPYLIDGDVKLTQSLAILKYLGRKFGLIGTSEKDIERQEVLDGVYMDVRLPMSLVVYKATDFEAEKKKYLEETLMPYLQKFDDQLADNSFLVGNKLTYSDFMFFEVFDIVNRMYDEKLLSQLPNVNKFHQTMSNLKGLKEFLESGKNFDKIFGPQAKWGG